MTLTTHTVVATAVGAALFPVSPVLAYVAAFASHFALDAVPHWEYKVPAVGRSIDGSENERKFLRISRAFLFDLSKIALDALIGISIAATALVMAGLPVIPFVAIGIIGGILPDALQFVYGRYPHEPLVSLQQFHIFVHGGRAIVNPVLGVCTQIAFIIPAFIYISQY